MRRGRKKEGEREGGGREERRKKGRKEGRKEKAKAQILSSVRLCYANYQTREKHQSWEKDHISKRWLKEIEVYSVGH